MSNNISWDDLPDIFSKDREFVTFFKVLFDDNQTTGICFTNGSPEYSNIQMVCHYAASFLAKYEIVKTKFSNDLTIEIKKLVNPTKKEVVQTILNSVNNKNDKELKRNILLYFSRLYGLKIIPLALGNKVLGETNYKISLSRDENTFLRIDILESKKNTIFNGIKFSLDDSQLKSVVAIESIEINGFKTIVIEPKTIDKNIIGVCFKGISIDNVEFLPRCKSSYFEVKQICCAQQDRIYSKTFSERYTHCQASFNGDVKIKKSCNENYIFSELEYPSVSCEKSSVNSLVYISQSTLDNLLDKGDSLDYLNLAEFLNKNGVYIEAQQLHRHYLLKKIQEKNAKENQDKCKLKKWCVENFSRYSLIKLYDLINGCGTSLLKPFVLWLGCWLSAYLVFLFSTTQLIVNRISFDAYFQFNILSSIKQAFLITIPLLATIEKPKIIELYAYDQIIIYFLMIFYYLLWFLFALQIRKFLKLKE